MKLGALVAGAEFAGSVCAQELAGVRRSVLVIDRRAHMPATLMTNSMHTAS